MLNLSDPLFTSEFFFGRTNVLTSLSSVEFLTRGDACTDEAPDPDLSFEIRDAESARDAAESCERPKRRRRAFFVTPTSVYILIRD